MARVYELCLVGGCAGSYATKRVLLSVDYIIRVALKVGDR